MKGKTLITFKNIAAVVILLVAVFIGTQLYSSIYKESTKAKESFEHGQKIKEKLEFLKDIQLAFHKKYDRYADQWEQLYFFIEKDSFYLMEKKEMTITLSYGADSTITSTDTLNVVSVYDSLISKGKYPKLDISELSKIPESEYEFELDAKNNNDFDAFMIRDTDPNTPKIATDTEGNVPLQIGSLTRPSTKGNWEK